MNVFSRDEFATKRRSLQDDAVEYLLPAVKESLGDRRWSVLLTRAHRLFNDVVREDSGGSAYPDAEWSKLSSRIERTLDKTKGDDEATANRIALWLSTLIPNAAAATAAQYDDEDLVLVWTTMHDDDVRAPHREADGQAKPVGEKYTVGGVEMTMPGDPSAPIELWINCRCTLRPDLMSNFSTLPGTAELSYSGADTEGDTMPDPIDKQTDAPDTVPGEDLGPVPFHSVLAPEGIKSGDGRRFTAGSLRVRPLPLPLTWQKTSAAGHDGNVTVAKIEQIARVNGEMHATGHMITNAESDEVMGLIAEFGRFGISIDADDATFEVADDEEVVDFTDARIASACIVPIPAFAEAWISLGEAPEGFMEGDDIAQDGPPMDAEAVAALVAGGAAVDIFKDLAPGKTEDGPGWLTHPVDTDRLRDYWVRGEGAAKIGWGTPGDFNRCRVNVAEYIKPQYLNGYCANRHYDALGFWPGRPVAGDTQPFAHETLDTESKDAAPALSLVAGGGIKAPWAWFQNPGLEERTPLTVTDDGRIFGHLAEWGVCHIGMSGVCTEPPKSRFDYSYFMNGIVSTEKGNVRAGNISIGGGHAGHRLNARAAVEHYDRTSAVVADVACGEDSVGIWVAGWVRPGVSDEMVYALRASGGLSGDWRDVAFDGELELVAALAVNAGGFPVPRVAAAVHDGVQLSLTASGMVLKDEQPEQKFDVKAMARAVVQEIAAAETRRKRMAELAASVNGD